jgi:hypothetical protein
MGHRVTPSDHVEHPPECLHANGHGDRSAGRPGRVAAAKAVGGVHSNRAHHVVADRALDLEHDDPAVLRCDLERFEQLWLLAGRELDIDHGANDLADVSVLGFLLVLRCLFGFRHRFALLQLDARMASAPLTISISSVVMPAWRTLFA